MLTTITDSELQQDVIKELKWEPSVDATAIGVAAKNRIVTLSGHVASYAEKRAAIEAAQRVHGVKAVVDELEVKLPSERTDEDIAADVISALRANVSVPDEKISATVAKGWVTLEGEVDWQYQRIAAENTVSKLSGVKGVINQIKVKPRVEPRDVKTKIEEAFKRNAELDAQRITVQVEGGKVVLRGTVRSWAERTAAETEAWSAPGVYSVENHIVVEP